MHCACPSPPDSPLANTPKVSHSPSGSGSRCPGGSSSTSRAARRRNRVERFGMFEAATRWPPRRRDHALSGSATLATPPARQEAGSPWEPPSTSTALTWAFGIPSATPSAFCSSGRSSAANLHDSLGRSSRHVAGEAQPWQTGGGYAHPLWRCRHWASGSDAIRSRATPGRVISPPLRRRGGPTLSMWSQTLIPGMWPPGLSTPPRLPHPWPPLRRSRTSWGWLWGRRRCHS
jgi:hypothetical protein